MSGTSNKIARKRTLGGVFKAARQHMTESFDGRHSPSGPSQMMSQVNYGISPLTDEEVRLLPVAHQYSS